MLGDACVFVRVRRRHSISRVVLDALECNLVVADTHLPIAATQCPDIDRIAKRICRSLPTDAIAAGNPLCNQTGADYFNETAVGWR